MTRTWIAGANLTIGSIASLSFFSCLACGPPEQKAPSQQESVESASESPSVTSTPEALAAAVPIYPDSTTVKSRSISQGERGGSALLLTTDDGSVEVMDFYLNQLEQDEWNVSNRIEQGNRVLLTFSRGDDTISIVIGPDQAGKTNILIAAEEALVSR